MKLIIFGNLNTSLFPNYLSKWKILSIKENLRIEPKGKTFKNLKLTSGKHTLFVHNVYDSLNEIVTLFSSQKKTINLIINEKLLKIIFINFMSKYLKILLIKLLKIKL